MEYVRETYPDPQNNEKAQTLIAFLFAVSGHQVQDAAWHSIGLLMGFIDEVAKVDCNGSFSMAHETLDWGGDAIFAKRYQGRKGSADWVYVCAVFYDLIDDREIGMFLSTILQRYIKEWASLCQLGK